MGWEAASAWFVHVGEFFLSSPLIPSQPCRQDYHWGGGAALGLNAHRQRRGWPKPFLCLLGPGLPFGPVGCQGQCLAIPVSPFSWGGFHLKGLRIPTGGNVGAPHNPLVLSLGGPCSQP